MHGNAWVRGKITDDIRFRANVRFNDYNHHYNRPYLGGYQPYFTHYPQAVYDRPRHDECYGHQVRHHEEREGFSLRRNIFGALGSLIRGTGQTIGGIVSMNPAHVGTGLATTFGGFFSNLFNFGGDRREHHHEQRMVREEGPRSYVNRDGERVYVPNDSRNQVAGNPVQSFAEIRDELGAKAMERISKYGVGDRTIDLAERTNEKNLALIANGSSDMEKSSISAEVIIGAKSNIDVVIASASYRQVQTELEQALRSKGINLSNLDTMQGNKALAYFENAAKVNGDTKLNANEVTKLLRDAGVSEKTIRSIESSDSAKLGAANAAVNMMQAIGISAKQNTRG